jgi:hypothetical protein
MTLREIDMATPSFLSAAGFDDSARGGLSGCKCRCWQKAPGGGDCDETSSRHHGYVSFYLNVERGASKSTGSETYFRPVQGGSLSRLRLLGYLGAQALFLRPELGSKLGTEVRCLEHLANLNLGFPFMRTGAAFDPLDRLFHRPYLP